MQKKQSRWMKNIVKTSATTDADLPWTRQARAAKRNAKQQKLLSARG